MVSIKPRVEDSLSILIERFPRLKSCVYELTRAYEMMLTSFENGGKLLVGGNGGSASDAEHIVAELMKSFGKERRISMQERDKFLHLLGKSGAQLVDKLEGSLPAISLNSTTSLLTAIANDIDYSMVFAQQVYGLGKPGDVLLLISTSGNSQNIIQAAQVGKVKGLATILLTGDSGGEAASIVDLSLKIPASSTFEIQEMHIAVYHQLCLWLENAFFFKD
ncbi:D-sedoheptulose-7-phosphate isomerase [Bacillus cereus]|uniref:D-sedoheptulose-7-phosphate isomerase n=1 Tax=Bacillus cereus TaxID=1396 RepID=UPI00065BA4BB|nr:SIS domain-containing protein [Bacillus cereus]KMQ32175.1 hypothetical protein TU58_01425 [Bacillus cereus]